MISALAKTTTAVLLALLVSACASVQTYQYYTIQPLAEAVQDSHELVLESRTVASVGVAPVKIPGWMDRSSLIVSDGAFKLKPLKNDRWGEPLEDALTRITSSNLRRMLNSAEVVSGPWLNSESPEIEIRIEILGLAQVGGELIMEARWDINDKAWQQHQSKTRKFSRRLNNGGTADQLVEGFSALLADMAREISADLL